jgi:myo-inositol-1(or 4)-monophosphatase
MTSLLKKAIAFAAKAHKGQQRKVSKLPYITHPLQVKLLISLFKESKNAELLQTAAILHDVVEDCNITVEEIEMKFGADTAKLVFELTNDKKQSRNSKQQIAYLTAKLMSMTSYALAIKLCDILHNAMDNPSQEFLNKYSAILSAVYTHRPLTASQLRILYEIKKYIKVETT